jgi:mannose-6-phosphate isomerase-like protein (cupin superfamily)
MEALKGTAFAGEGLLWAYDNKTWCIGIKNYKPANSIESLDCLEVHKETDEIFVHIDGSCCLLMRDADGSFHGAMMEPGSLYTVPQGVWHTTVTKPGVKMVIAEKSGTNMTNSELMKLDAAEQAAAAAAVRAAGF